MNINLTALRKNLEALGRIGRDKDGGVSRPSFSPADLEARAWLKDKIEAAGLAVPQDGAGNIFGRLGGGSGKAVMAGSHIDTVLGGGAFDGAAGVLAALEASSASAKRDGGSPSRWPSPRSRTRRGARRRFPGQPRLHRAP